MGRVRDGPSLAEVHELEGLRELEAADMGDGGLQLVALLPAHAQLVALDRDLELELAVLERVREALGQLPIDPLLDHDRLPERIARCPLGLLELEGRGIDLAPDEMALQE